MTVTIKKVGEAAAKGAAKTVLRPPRAVTAVEAPTIQEARESNTSTMMPWKGWIARFMQDTMGKDRYEQLRKTMLFMPDDIYDLHQAPKPTQKIPISKDDPNITHMYRHPSPGSQGPVRQPMVEEGQDPFDVGYFKKDTQRRYEYSELGNPELEKAKLELMGNPETDPKLKAEWEKIEAGPTESSQGNQGKFATGPSDFDPTGLRATMSVSWKELQKSLDAHMPDHLPTPTWVGKEQEVIDFYQSRGLPVPVGGFYEGNKVSRERRVARW